MCKEAKMSRLEEYKDYYGFEPKGVLILDITPLKIEIIDFIKNAYGDDSWVYPMAKMLTSIIADLYLTYDDNFTADEIIPSALRYLNRKENKKYLMDKELTKNINIIRNMLEDEYFQQVINNYIQEMKYLKTNPILGMIKNSEVEYYPGKTINNLVHIYIG
jgi:hypothetical protein